MKRRDLYIVVDGQKVDFKKFRISYPYEHKPRRGEHWLTCAQIKGVAGVDHTSALYLEGDAEDRILKDGELVSIRGGERFYSVPTATM